MDLARISFPTVNSLGCVKVLTNSYSAPLKPGTQLQAKISASTVELWHDGRSVARHERCYGRQQQLAAIKKYAAGHDIKIVKVFREEGISGTTELEKSASTAGAAGSSGQQRYQAGLD